MKSIYLTLLFSIAANATTTHINTARLMQLVNINSGSANLEGVRKVQETIKPWFEELGFKTEFKNNPQGEKVSAPILLARLEGEKKEAITLIMHADTVFEPSSPFQKAEVKKNIMHGPGVIDDKGGIIVALQALKNYTAALGGKKPKYTILVEITPNEEVGAIGWWDEFARLSQESWLALSLEPSLNEGGIVEGRKGNLWFEVTVTGKEAHAGVDHKAGINACKILAEKITQLSALTDYKKNITVSVGHIEGGQNKFNIVCGSAKAKIDTRVPNPKVRDELKAKFAKILKHPNITYQITDETVPMSPNSISKPLVKKYLDTITKVEGKRYLAYFSGGVGDANHFAREGIAIIDGLGPIGGGLHTTEEWIDLHSIETRAKVLSGFLLGL